MRFGKPIKNTKQKNPRYFLNEDATVDNRSNRNLHDVQFYLEEFYPFAKNALQFEQDATIVFESDFTNAKNPLGKTAHYNPDSSTVTVYVDKRHPKDVMRSISHELVHHAQNVRGDLQGSSMEEGYAQNDKHLREMEKEAYTKGNMLFRDWTDSRSNPDGQQDIMTRLMQEWGYDEPTLTEEGAGFEEGQLVKVVSSALAIDGEKLGTVVSYEDPAVLIKLDDDQEGKYVPDDKMVKVKKDYVEARADSGFADTMGEGYDVGKEVWMEKFKLHARIPQNQEMSDEMRNNALAAHRQGMDPQQAAEELRAAGVVGEDMYDDDFDDDEFDMESLEQEFPWLAKDVKTGKVPASVAAELADEFGDKEAPEEEEESVVMKEGDFVGHHAEIDGKTYVDSDFLNSVKKIRDTFPHELKSMGFGEFYLETPKGKVQFDRTRGQSVQGTVPSFVGRAHQLYGEPPELADELMAAMEAAGASEAASIEGVAGSDSDGYSKVAGSRPMQEAPIELEEDDFDLFEPDPGDPDYVGPTDEESVTLVHKTSGKEIVVDADAAEDRVATGEWEERNKMKVAEKMSPEEEKEMTDKMSNKEFYKYITHDKHVRPSIDRERYTEIPGMEGPFQFDSGAILYYDPKTGDYYDRDKDMYLDRDEAAQLTMETVTLDEASVNEAFLALEMFDTGSAGDDVGGMSNDEKKSKCEKDGGSWVGGQCMHMKENKNLEGEDEMNLEEIVRTAVRNALKEKKYRREDEKEEEEKVEEKLSAAQKELDLDDDGKIEPSDLKGLRAGKKDDDVGEEAEEKEEKEKNEGKQPPWLKKKGEDKEDDEKEEKNEAVATGATAGKYGYAYPHSPDFGTKAWNERGEERAEDGKSELEKRLEKAAAEEKKDEAMMEPGPDTPMTASPLEAFGFDPADVQTSLDPEDGHEIHVIPGINLTGDIVADVEMMTQDEELDNWLYGELDSDAVITDHQGKYQYAGADVADHIESPERSSIAESNKEWYDSKLFESLKRKWAK